MEYRNDLASVLLSGLPEHERDHVVRVIHEVDAEKLRRKRAEVVDLSSVDLEAVDSDEPVDELVD